MNLVLSQQLGSQPTAVPHQFWALSNYLMHSIILTTVLYGYGLRLYGSISRFGQVGFVVPVIALRLLLSPWWLARYRFGPVEWLWRSLTYWQRQPMLR